VEAQIHAGQCDGADNGDVECSNVRIMMRLAALSAVVIHELSSMAGS
jgi:hypothetical protein